jgi:hypothetical protein
MVCPTSDLVFGRIGNIGGKLHAAADKELSVKAEYGPVRGSGRVFMAGERVERRLAAILTAE